MSVSGKVAELILKETKLKPAMLMLLRMFASFIDSYYVGEIMQEMLTLGWHTPFYLPKFTIQVNVFLSYLPFGCIAYIRDFD